MSSPAADAGLTGLIDIHTHLLPGVDDGCRDVRESVEAARRLADFGFTHAFCTPHVQREFPHNRPAQIAPAVARLQAELDKAGVPLILVPGGENRLDDKTADTPPDDLVILGGDAGGRGGRFFLFDTWEHEWPDYMERAVGRLMAHGVTPVMAHPERCPFVCSDPLDAADRLAEMGVLLQLNSYLLAGESAAKKNLYREPMVRCAERLIEFDYYSFLATDTHGASGLDERLEGLNNARETLGEEDFDRLLRRNPAQLLPAEGDG